MIHQEAFTYVTGIFIQGNKIRNLAGLIKSYDSVFIVGAGISFEAGVPLANTVEYLLKFVGANNYEELRLSEDNCLLFKNEFAKVCNRKLPTISHRALANNLGRTILEIICLNWDDLIERAGKECGRILNVQHTDNNDVLVNGRCLWKFHGDIQNIQKSNIKGSDGWVFPDEGGFIFDSFLQLVNTDIRLRSLYAIIIVGYSERDERVNEVIRILKLNGRRPIFKIGLDFGSLKSEDYIVGPSDFVLSKLFDLH
jgi:hypothetical protein